jgi:hypothetical protein
VVRGRWESVTQEARPDFVLTVVGAQDRWWQEDVDLQMIVGKKEVTVTEAKTEASAFDEHPRKYHEAESRGALPLPFPIIYVGLAGSLSALWCLRWLPCA